MNPVNNLPYLIQHLAGVMAKQSEQLLKKQFGIGMSQYRILIVLEWNPRVGQRAIADSLGQTEASISRQIKVMEKQGLLSAQVDPQNRRKHITAPTLKGMQVTEAAADLLKREGIEDLSVLGADHLSQLNSSLQKLHKKICRPGKAGACDHQLGF
jgi:DNA-binding MarR family transcriptional regulator